MKTKSTGFKETEIGPIPEEWEVSELGDIAKVVSGFAFSGTEISSSGECPIIRLASIGGGRVFLDDAVRYSGIATEIPDQFWVSKGDLLIAMTGGDDSNLETAAGRVGKYFEDRKALVNQRVGKIVVTKPELIDKVFLYFWLIQQSVTRALATNAHGSAQSNLTVGHIDHLILPTPPLTEQARIASILSSLDDKIELNRQMNANLEKMASALFKRWFVDFEFPDEKGRPYKSSGGKMVETEMGEVPEGWRVSNFIAVIESSLNGDWGMESETEGYKNKVFCIRGADIPELKEGRMGKMPIRFIKDTNFKNKRLLIGDVVIETSGGTPTQSTGRCALITDELLSRFEYPLICSNFCKVVRFKDANLAAYLYLALDEMYKHDDFFQFENGTSGIKNLDINSLLESLEVKIENRVSLQFSQLFGVLYRMIQKNGWQNYALSQIRDSLLPRLMNGKIRV